MRKGARWKRAPPSRGLINYERDLLSGGQQAAGQSLFKKSTGNVAFSAAIAALQDAII